MKNQSLYVKYLINLMTQDSVNTYELTTYWVLMCQTKSLSLVEVESRDVNIILIYKKCIACKRGAGDWEWNSWALSWQREILTSMSHHPHGIQIHMARSPLPLQIAQPTVSAPGTLSQTFTSNDSHASLNQSMTIPDRCCCL